MDEIHIDFQWQRDEYLRISRKGPLARSSRRFLISAAAMIFGAIVLITEGYGMGWYVLGLGVVYCLLSFWMLIGLPKKAWKIGNGI